MPISSLKRKFLSMADGKVRIRFSAGCCIKTYLIGEYMKTGFKEIILAVCVVLFSGLPGVVHAGHDARDDTVYHDGQGDR
jgi:hypothetical protein